MQSTSMQGRDEWYVVCLGCVVLGLSGVPRCAPGVSSEVGHEEASVGHAVESLQHLVLPAPPLMALGFGREFA